MHLIYTKNDTQLNVLKLLDVLSQLKLGDIESKYTTHIDSKGDEYKILVVYNLDRSVNLLNLGNHPLIEQCGINYDLLIFFTKDDDIASLVRGLD